MSPVDISGVIYVEVDEFVYAVWYGIDTPTYIKSAYVGSCENIELIMQPDIKYLWRPDTCLEIVIEFVVDGVDVMLQAESIQIKHGDYVIITCVVESLIRSSSGNALMVSMSRTSSMGAPIFVTFLIPE